jgi:hypothetical protein
MYVSTTVSTSCRIARHQPISLLSQTHYSTNDSLGPRRTTRLPSANPPRCRPSPRWHAALILQPGRRRARLLRRQPEPLPTRPQGQYGPPQGQYGPPQGQYGYGGQQMQYQQGPPPPGGYYQDDRRADGGGGGLFAGLCAGLACCCCLDCLF